jgi:hypothetical protein
MTPRVMWPAKWPKGEHNVVIGPCRCGAWHHKGTFTFRSGVLKTNYKPSCIVCNRVLEPVFDDQFQPNGGGEVKLIFAYGSREFDLNIPANVFRGVICDTCAKEVVPKCVLAST